MGWTAKDSWFEFSLEQEILLFPKTPRPALGSAQPHAQWVPGREADRSTLI